ncbi:hypothetical protein Pla52o_48640 [Novipirellula galeiformis]|uniref:Uncharacterized protein n=1 Tax=Novipirellula galeiformis TaxID=2528004 RepID=A0A5C6C4C7_9BACT|nr:hypothetical protein Pla52o_48640 [Novipirellula galeiformis]
MSSSPLGKDYESRDGLRDIQPQRLILASHDADRSPAPPTLRRPATKDPSGSGPVR